MLLRVKEGHLSLTMNPFFLMGAVVSRSPGYSLRFGIMDSETETLELSPVSVK